MLILTYFSGHSPDPYPLELFSLEKPVVMTISFTSGLWNDTQICENVDMQAELIGKSLERYDEVGSPGVIVQRWGSDLYQNEPIERCGFYTASSLPVIQVLSDFALQLNPPSYPTQPLQFVSISP